MSTTPRAQLRARTTRWVVDRQIRDDQVGEQQFLEHVRADVAGTFFLIRTQRREIRSLEGRPYELVVDAIEVDRLPVGSRLVTERHRNKCMRLAASQCLFGRPRWRHIGTRGREKILQILEPLRCGRGLYDQLSKRGGGYRAVIALGAATIELRYERREMRFHNAEK